MTPKLKKLLLELINDKLNQAQDNRMRAEMAFKRYTPERMRQPYCESRSTCQEILDAYKHDEAEMEKARQEVLAL